MYLRIHNDKQPFIPQCMYKGNTTLCKFSCCIMYVLFYNSILPMVSSFKNKIGTVVQVLPTAPISICRSLNIGTFGRYNKCLKSLTTLPSPNATPGGTQVFSPIYRLAYFAQIQLQAHPLHRHSRSRALSSTSNFSPNCRASCAESCIPGFP